MKCQWKGPALAGATLLTACSGGGGAETSVAAPVQLRDYYQAYVSVSPEEVQSLVLVDVADFTRRLNLGPVGEIAVLYAGTIGGALIHNYRPHSGYFVQDGAWRRVSMRHEGSQAPVRVSSEALDRSCMPPVLVEQTLGSQAGAELYYSLPGADASCGTSDDLYRRIGIADSAATAARPGAVGDQVWQFRNATGKLVSVLAYETATGNLRRYPAGLASVTEVATGAFVLPLMHAANYALILEGNSIRRVDASGVLSAPLHTLTGYLDRWNAVADDNYYYFVDGPDDAPSLYRVLLDGSMPAEPVLEGYADLTILGETPGSLVVAAQTMGLDLVTLQLDKGPAGMEPTLLQELPPDAFVSRVSRRQPILYNVVDWAATTAYRFDDDGTVTEGPADSAWMGVQLPSDPSLAALLTNRQPELVGAFRADGSTGSGVAGAIASHVDLASGAETVLTPLDHGYVFAFAIGSIGMAIAHDFDPEFGSDFDVLSFDLEERRLELHAETAPDGKPFNEYPYAL